MSKPIELTPNFNPTNAPDHEVYPEDFRLDPADDFGFRPYSDFEPDTDLVDIYRLEQRERVANGIGITASRIVQLGTLGDPDSLHPADHMYTHQESRDSSAGKTTPYVSFATDPDFIARKLILGLGWGLKDGSDSVVVKARVKPGRILSQDGGKQDEVLLPGGLASGDYLGIDEIEEFVQTHVDSNEPVVTSRVGEVKPGEAIERWRLKAKTSSRSNKH